MKSTNITKWLESDLHRLVPNQYVNVYYNGMLVDALILSNNPKDSNYTFSFYDQRLESDVVTTYTYKEHIAINTGLRQRLVYSATALGVIGTALVLVNPELAAIVKALKTILDTLIGGNGICG